MRTTGTLHEDLCTFVIISRSVLRMRNVSGKFFFGKIKTHFMANTPHRHPPKIVPFIR